MKRLEVVRIGKDWWKEERKPSSSLVVKKKKAVLSEKYYSPRALAERLALSVDVIYDLIRSGELSAQKIGRVYRIGQDAIEDYLVKKTG